MLLVRNLTFLGLEKTKGMSNIRYRRKKPIFIV